MRLIWMMLLFLIIGSCGPCLPEEEPSQPPSRQAPAPSPPQVWEPPPYLMCEEWGYACDPSDDPALLERESEVRQELMRRRLVEEQDDAQLATWLRSLPDIGGVVFTQGGNLAFWMEGGQPFFYATIRQEVDISVLDDIPEWDGDFGALPTREQPLVVHHEESREEKRALILSPLWWWGGSMFRRGGDRLRDLLKDIPDYQHPDGITYIKNRRVSPDGFALTNWIGYDFIAIDTHGFHEFKPDPKTYGVPGFLMSTGVFQTPPSLKALVKDANMNQVPDQTIGDVIKNYAKSEDGAKALKKYDEGMCEQLEIARRQDPTQWRGIHCFSMKFNFSYIQGNKGMRTTVTFPAITLGVSADYFAPKRRGMRPLKNKFIVFNACESSEGKEWIKPIVDDETTVAIGWTTAVDVNSSTNVVIDVVRKMTAGISFASAAKLLGDLTAPRKHGGFGTLTKISGEGTEQRIREIITLLDEDGVVELDAQSQAVRLQGPTRRELPLVVQVDGVTPEEDLDRYVIEVFAAEQGHPVGFALQSRVVTLGDPQAREIPGSQGMRSFKVPIRLRLSATQVRDPALELVAIVQLPEGGDSRDSAIAPIETTCPSWTLTASGEGAAGTDAFSGNYALLEPVEPLGGFTLSAHEAYRNGDGLLQLRAPTMDFVSTEPWKGSGTYVVDAFSATRVEGGESSYIEENLLVEVEEVSQGRFDINFQGMVTYVSGTGLSDVGIQGELKRVVVGDETQYDGCY